jgi:hypothetical protein
MLTVIGEIAKSKDVPQPSIAPIAADMQPATICYVHRAWVYFRIHSAIRTKPNQDAWVIYQRVLAQYFMPKV